MEQPEFGKQLAKIRKAKGLTQVELAEACEVSHRTIQRIEAGTVTPRSFTVKAISNALEYDFLEAFFNGSLEKEETLESRFVSNHWIITHAIDLFNFKKNTMKKLTFLTIITALISIAIFSFSNKSFAQGATSQTNFLTIETANNISQKEVVKLIERIKQESGRHTKALNLLQYYAENSDYNYDTYALLSKMVGSFGSSTIPIMEIANSVFFCYKDCDLFNEIAPLVFLNKNDADRYVKLAKKARVAHSEREVREVKALIDVYKEQTEFVSLEEAFKA